MYLVPVLFTFHIQGVLKLKKNHSGAKSLMCSHCATLRSLLFISQTLRRPTEKCPERNICLLYSFFWVIPRRLNFICRCFGTSCMFHLHARCKVFLLTQPMQMGQTLIIFSQLHAAMYERPCSLCPSSINTGMYSHTLLQVHGIKFLCAFLKFPKSDY